MNKILAVTLAVLGCVGAVISVCMLIMAFEFLEWGRVLFYLLLTFACLQIGIWGVVSAVKKKK